MTAKTVEREFRATLDGLLLQHWSAQVKPTDTEWLEGGAICTLTEDRPSLTAQLTVAMRRDAVELRETILHEAIHVALDDLHVLMDRVLELLGAECRRLVASEWAELEERTVERIIAGLNQQIAGRSASSG